MAGITLDLDDREFRTKLARLIQRMDNLQPALTDIGAEMEKRVHQRFEFKRDPAGQEWAKWAPTTAARRAKTGEGELLELSRNMLGSLNYQVDAETVVVGFGARYAIYHEFGAKKERAERSATVYFKAANGVVGNRFTKKSKSNFAQDVTIGAHTVELPRRGLLTADPEAVTLGDGDREAVLTIVEDYLAGS